jgi:membrane-bound serine protease (ClpP class)
LAAGVLGAVLIAGVAEPLPAAADNQLARTAIVLELEDIVGPPVAEYIAKEIRAAPERHAALVVIRIDTPGGLDGAMRDIIRAILSSTVPVATYVAPSGARAASAGTYILYASHIAAMAPGTNLGAATPIAIGAPPSWPGDREEPKEKEKGSPGKDPNKSPADREGKPRKDAAPASPPKDTMSAKLINDAVAYIRALAKLHGRNAEWAEKAVREAVSLSSDDALEQKVIDIVATDVKQLLAQADGRTVNLGGNPRTLATRDLAIVTVEPDWRTRVLSALANPNVAFILLLLGIYGIIFEFAHPGTVAPGVVGSICLLVGLFALNLLPLNYAGIALLLLGLALMVAEAFVPAFGILGIGGLVSFAIGALMLFDTGVPGLQLALPVVIGTTVVSGAFFLIVLSMLIRSRRRAVVSGDEALINAAGEVLAWHESSGTVLVQGERWQARAQQPLTPGEKIKVIARDGLVLTVDRA